MESKAVSGIILILLLMGILTLAYNVQPVKAESTTWTVDDDGPAVFSSIQEAVNSPDVKDGDTLYVHNGTYYEHVAVSKNVSLIGEDRSTTIIDGGGVGTVVTVVANNVSVSGFTIRNAGYEPILWAGTYSGVLVTSSDNIISNNIITNGDRGISIKGAKGNIIDNNTVSNNEWYGIDLYGSSENIISNNLVTSNDYGIFFYFGSIGNKADNNTMSKNGVGICLEYAQRNTLRNNNLTGNTYGLKMGLGIGLEDLIQDIDTSNFVDGKPICYLVEQENVLINQSTFPNGVGYLGIVGSRNVTAKDLSISGSYQGVFLANTTDSRLQNISAWNCYYGVHLFKSTRNTLAGCSLSTYDSGFYVSASNDNIIFNNTIINSGCGIHLYFNVAGNILSNNRISGTVFGIDSYTCYNNTVTENVVSNCSSGISLRGSRNVISENNVSYCEYGGIDVALSNFTVISGNLLTHNGMGIWITSSHNIIFENTLISNEHGFDVRYCTNNAFYHNNVVNNTMQAYLVDTTNEWDDGYPSGGNYWSDYTGIDAKSGPNQDQPGNDGIGDTPYVIDENNQDNYPLVEPWSPKPPSPQEALEELTQTVESWNLGTGIENSLTSKLQAAHRSLDREIQKASLGQLKAFINQVRALRDKKLTNEQADQLIAEAQRIIDLIES